MDMQVWLDESEGQNDFWKQKEQRTCILPLVQAIALGLDSFCAHGGLPSSSNSAHWKNAQLNSVRFGVSVE